jgi:hypothetical protein
MVFEQWNVSDGCGPYLSVMAMQLLRVTRAATGELPAAHVAQPVRGRVLRWHALQRAIGANGPVPIPDDFLAGIERLRVATRQ